MINTTDILDLSHTLAKDYLEKTQYPWEALASIGDYIIEIGKTLSVAAFCSERWI